MVNIDDYKIDLEGEIKEQVSPLMKAKFEGLSIRHEGNKVFDWFSHSTEESVVDSRVSHWANQFSMKALHLEYNYGYMIMYYITLGDVDVYEEFTAENLGNHFWFSYEAESLLNRLYTAVDYIFHILDEKYRLRTTIDSQFRNNVIKGLRVNNPELCVFLKEIANDSRYRCLVDLRNNFMHNHSPLSVSAGISEEEGVITVGTGKYVIPSVIVNAVDDFIDILHLVVNKINECL